MYRKGARLFALQQVYTPDDSYRQVEMRSSPQGPEGFSVKMPPQLVEVGDG